jgi:acyl-CoA synthetase (AMP-forming)/AMP-acid ligase II/acyl carrier protein
MSHSYRAKSLVELLNRRASLTSNDTAFIYLDEGHDSTSRITYGELLARATAIGAHLQGKLRRTGEPVLLLIQPGVHYICAFFGCIYAGAIPVPAYPPSSARQLPRLQSILNDAQARMACTTTADLQRVVAMEQRSEKLPVAEWLVVDSLPESAPEWRDPGLDENSVAFLQYTSGSTSAPKGVMVGQSNLLKNVELIGHRVQSRSNDLCVFWLPPYHDFGLIGGILYPVFWGHASILMRPSSFLVSPYKWLKAISDFKATITGAPNFAYDLCIRKVTQEQRDSLDLSCVRVALNGAEPIRADTLYTFARTFASCGFRSDAWLPAYGLAESTLMVSGREQKGASSESAVKCLTLSKEALAQNAVVLMTSQEGASLVSSGSVLAETEVAIVNPDTHKSCSANEVGEIWVQGPCVAQGYWQRPQQSQETFHATMPFSDGGSYLRTGDLGFFHGGELYVCGRLKDLIVISGRNIFPQDVESASFDCDQRLRPGGGAAFSFPSGPAEQLVIALELEFRVGAIDGLFGAVAASVSAAIGTLPDIILLLRPGQIPRTSSGKVQRHLCKRHFIEGSLDVAARWDRFVVNAVEPIESAGASQHVADHAIAHWLRTQLARRLNLEFDDIDPGQPFAFHGLDSQMTVQVGHDLQTWLQRSISPTLFWDYPTITQLSRFLSNECKDAA